ncbi:peroxiredoxin-like family protein [Vibrio aestuarianus]|uniref:thioredoxin-dependent peroxiredoxin n=1 Tax=Vibrio aestuarianus TaxID=28171 RepID=A0A9X4IRF6_9VIBR|nr:peroxiredoxin-like family protein [Vibrio aestuarianus]MDE1244077.1 AhpC/TSA family protein [Vibrio aestuarianus]
MSNLKETMDAFQTKFESGAAPYNVKPTQVTVMHQFDDELRNTGILENIPRPGNKFPSFALENQEGETIKLNTLLERGPVVVSFFRGMWCPYCIMELQALQKSLTEIDATGATLVAISPQLSTLNKQTINQNKLSFDILNDNGNALAESLGIAYRLGDELIEKVYNAFGVKMSQFNGDDSWRLPLSSRFVIDTEGTIIAVDADVNYRSRPEPEETIAILRALLAV